MTPDEATGRRLTAEEIFQPWELSGQSRRDCLPHRAGLLGPMSYVSLVAGGATFACLVSALIAFPLGIATYLMACHDLELIRRGDMDQSGFHRTEKARSDARAGVILACLGFLPGLVLTACLGLVVLFATWR
jgi:hypothetical protein